MFDGRESKSALVELQIEATSSDLHLDTAPVYFASSMGMLDRVLVRFDCWGWMNTECRVQVVILAPRSIRQLAPSFPTINPYDATATTAMRPYYFNLDHIGRAVASRMGLHPNFEAPRTALDFTHVLCEFRLPNHTRAQQLTGLTGLAYHRR
jgi:hypothetical protein